RASLLDREEGAAKLAVARRIDLAAQLMREQLFAIADAEDRELGLVRRLRREGRAFLHHARGAAGEDDALGRECFGPSLIAMVERPDLGIDAGLADAPRDQLRHLAPEVDDEDLVGHITRFQKRDSTRRTRRSRRQKSPIRPSFALLSVLRALRV